MGRLENGSNTSLQVHVHVRHMQPDMYKGCYHLGSGVTDNNDQIFR